jgi:hypothetical protein
MAAELVGYDVELMEMRRKYVNLPRAWFGASLPMPIVHQPRIEKGEFPKALDRYPVTL